jgi:uncharacterized protein (DUF1015 family)
VSTIRAFRALRPRADKAKEVSCVPYDVVGGDEVVRHIHENPLSFLRVTRPEAEFATAAAGGPAVFDSARATLQSFLRDGVMVQDDEPAVYVYRLESNTHTQTGVVACCSLDEYERGLIKKHEHTQPDKVDDRTRHMLSLRAQTGLIFLAYRGTARIDALVEEAVKGEPLFDFSGHNEVRQTVWRARDAEPFVEAFGDVPALYIADGHHRIESAEQAKQTLKREDPQHAGDEEYNFVLAGIFPAEQLRIAAYNRVVTDLGGLTEEGLLARLSDSFRIEENGKSRPDRHGEICMYLNGRWRDLTFAVENVRQPDPVERLDVSILQDHILGPILGIDDPRTNKRIAFVGGGRGVEELERLVDTGEAAVAFSLYPTTMTDLLEVSDADQTMPPKSTWFEPKLKDGLFVHLI